MILHNLVLTGDNRVVNIKVDDGKITGFPEEPLPDQLQLSFTDALVFPGLINSHDHLDFNLFPQLGDKVYGNYTEWGGYIHKNYKDEINAVLKVPITLREEWGVIKNLICGVTMVVNHGENVKIKDRLICIHEQYYFLHSVQFEKNWKRKFNHPLRMQHPVVIHVGEGTDRAAHDEIDQLIRWNLLRKTLIGIHAVAMSADQAKRFKAIVWCPESNHFLLNRIAPINQFKASTKILFGTDSTLTGDWDIWKHIRLARKTNMLTDTELYETLNRNPAAIWGTQNGEITHGKDADLVVSRIKNNQNSMDAFFAIEPKDILLVLHQGNIRLFDALLYDQLMQK